MQHDIHIHVRLMVQGDGSHDTAHQARTRLQKHLHPYLGEWFTENLSEEPPFTVGTLLLFSTETTYVDDGAWATLPNG